MTKKTLKISGMHCASCAVIIEKELKKKGTKNASVNFATGKAVVDYDENKVEVGNLEKAIIEAGYKVVKDNHGGKSDEHDHFNQNQQKWEKIKVIIAIILTLPVFIRMFWDWSLPGNFFGISITSWVQHDLAFLVVFILGWQFHVNAFKQIRKLRSNMDTLISLGTLTAYFYSLYAMFAGRVLYFESAATITTLILLGKFLELKTKNRASLAMQKLMELGVKQARIIKDGKEVNVDVDKVKIGDIFMVKPGEKLPLDGLVINGSSTVDESMLTGESMPISKKDNDKVFAATMNKDGVLKVKVTKTSGETALAQIIKTVEQTQAFKAPIQRLADQIAGIFVPTVITIAGLTFLGWWLIGGNPTAGLINAVAVLIISCPCALGIATPMAVMVGSSVGARKGILIKGGESFEKARKINTVIFDKTGTLTKGKPVVRKIILNQKFDFTKDKVIKIAASLSTHSEHPLSQAITQFVKEKSISLTEVIDFKEIIGKGVQGQCQAHKTNLFLGNNKLMLDNGLGLEWVENLLEENKESGSSVLFVAHDKDVIGALFLADEIKENSRQAIIELKKMNLQSIIISGDNKNTAKSVAQELGIDEYYAEVLPTEKQNKVKAIQANGKKVVFVGDGINDAPALIQADLGIAMGGGTDIAKESGEIIIMQSDPLTVVESIKLSRKTFGVIKQNLFWAFFYNVLAIPLAVFGIATPMIGALAMSLSDIAVIGNSLRIYRK